METSWIGGHQVWPTCAVYSGTKFAVLAISEGLRLETKDIRVTVITPGVVESDWQTRSPTYLAPCTCHGLRHRGVG